ncbi:MAG: alpha/beta hydrolase [Actinomycetia bacterium]|nr:alpha/beta hydrolase [Actinomycetes bacterium]
MPLPTTRPVRIPDPEHDIVLDVATAGSAGGRPVLLLHGFPETHAEWRDVIPLLADAGLRVYAVDQRGYSRGARPPGVAQYDQAHLVRDVVSLVHALGHERVHLVGHDWGAMVAWSVAAPHPEVVHTLTAVSVPHPAALYATAAEDADQRERLGYTDFLRLTGKAERVLAEDGFRRLRAMYGDWVPTELADAHVARLAEPGALTGALSYYRASQEDYERTPVVRVPTTLVWGSEDPVCGRVAVQRCRDFVAGEYELVELAGISHWVPEQVPEETAAAVIARAGD